ncbi:BamA/OMP85 family outer membrane protein [Selenomonas montiformis]
MNKTNKQFLAYAVALAASFSTVPGVSHAAAAAEPSAAAAPVMQADAAAQNVPSAAEAKAEEPKAQQAGEAAQTSAKTSGENAQADERAKEWNKTRPQDKAIEDMMKQYEGLTIVDTVFEGTTKLTETTAKAALSMRTGDMFTAKGLNKDRDAIYNTGYFYDLYPSFEKVPEGVVITYHVLENPVLTSIRIDGNTVEKDEVLYGLVTVKKGEILNSRTLQQNVQAIQDQYRKDGYILAKITDMNIDRQGNLVLRVNEGILEGYKVKGNTKTKERVILREMRQKPGQPFNSKLARRSMQRVYNLGFFEDVNIKLNPGVDPNAVVVELDVKEKRTGSFGIGAGYSSEDGVIGMVSLGDTNFRGTGDAISVTYETSGDDEDAHGYSISYRHPWIDQKETVGTVRIYNRTYEYDDYDTDGDLKETYMRKYSGGELTLGRPVSEYSTNYVTLRNRKDQYVRHVDDGWYASRKGTAWERDNFGTTRSVTLEHVTDTRDNIYNPTTGGRISLSGEVAGLGGDFDFQKMTIEDQRYHKVGHAQVLALRAQYGIGHGHISEFNQYKVGGQSSLRGYREDQFRGNRMALATLEYRFPIVSKVQGALFTDWGGAWNDGVTPKDIKGSVGVGLALNTPLGPLRLDYGRGRDGGRVHFTVGGSF